MFNRLTAAALVAAIGVSGPAFAETVTFDFLSENNFTWTQPESGIGRIQVSNGDITADVIGRTIDNAAAGNGSTISGDANIVEVGISQWDGYGLGIQNSAGDNSHQVDGSGFDDFIEFQFSEEVTITSVAFSYYSSSDDFRIMWDSTEDGVIGAGDAMSFDTDIPNGGIFGGLNVTTDLFAIGAFQSDDSWKLGGITLTYETNPPPSGPPGSTVPLPASALLLLSGIAGLGALRLRRRSS